MYAPCIRLEIKYLSISLTWALNLWNYVCILWLAMCLMPIFADAHQCALLIREGEKKIPEKSVVFSQWFIPPQKNWDKFSIGKIPTWGGGRFGKRSHFLRVLPFKLESAQQKSCFKKTYLTHRTLPKANQQRKVSNAAKFSSDEPKSIAGTLVSIDWTSVRHFQHHRTWQICFIPFLLNLNHFQAKLEQIYSFLSFPRFNLFRIWSQNKSTSSHFYQQGLIDNTSSYEKVTSDMTQV